MIEQQRFSSAYQKQNVLLPQPPQEGQRFKSIEYAQIYLEQKKKYSQEQEKLYNTPHLSNIREENEKKKQTNISTVISIYKIYKYIYKLHQRQLSSCFSKLVCLDIASSEGREDSEEELVNNDKREEVGTIKRVLSKISQQYDQQTKQQIQVSSTVLRGRGRYGKKSQTSQKKNEVKISVLGAKQNSPAFWMNSNFFIEVPLKEKPIQLSIDKDSGCQQNIPTKLSNLQPCPHEQQDFLGREEKEMVGKQIDLEGKNFSICHSSRSYTLYYKNQVLKQLQTLNRNKSWLTSVEIIKGVSPSIASTINLDYDEDNQDNSSQIERIDEFSQSQFISYGQERTNIFSPKVSWKQNVGNFSNMLKTKCSPSSTVKEVNKNKLKGKKKIKIRLLQ